MFCTSYRCGWVVGRNHTTSCLVHRLLRTRYGEAGAMPPPGTIGKLARDLGLPYSFVCRIAWKWGFYVKEAA